MKKKKNYNKFIYLIISIFSIIIIIFSGFKLFNWNKENKKVKDIQKEILDENIQKEEKVLETTNINPPEDKSDDYFDYIKMDMMSADFNELKKKNSDTVGFIKINGTNINYPVVQTNNNDFYLNHAFDKSKNSAGWIFADYRNDMKNFDKNTIIYGHGRLNNTMFGSLKNILKSDWYNNKDNYIIKFSTPYENTLWQVFSVYSIPVESYYLQTKFSDNNSYQAFLNTLKSRSKKNFSANVNANDKIITLSTCLDVAGSGRVVMHAKLIKKETRY